MKTFFAFSVLASALTLGSGAVLVGCGNSSDSGVDTDNGKAISSLDVSGDLTVNKGGQSQLTATVKYADGSTADVTKDGDLVWNIGNTSVATIDSDGMVHGVSVGGTTVKATYQGKESDSHDIVVTPDRTALGAWKLRSSKSDNAAVETFPAALLRQATTLSDPEHAASPDGSSEAHAERVAPSEIRG